MAGVEQTRTSHLEPGGSQDGRRNEHGYLPAQDVFHVLEGEEKKHSGCGAPEPQAHQPAQPWPPTQMAKALGLS